MSDMFAGSPLSSIEPLDPFSEKVSRDRGATVTYDPSPMHPKSLETDEKMREIPDLGRNLSPAQRQKAQYIDLAVKAFSPLEKYLQTTFSSWECLNRSFMPIAQTVAGSRSDSSERKPSRSNGTPRENSSVSELIPVTKVPGEKETVMLRMGPAVRREHVNALGLSEKPKDRTKRDDNRARNTVRVPAIDWNAARAFYDQLLEAGDDILSELKFCRLESSKDTSVSLLDSDDNHNLEFIELALHEARVTILTSMLRTTESLLKRPGHALTRPEDVRFLLILLANPLLSPGSIKLTTSRISPPNGGNPSSEPSRSGGSKDKSSSRTKSREGRSGIGGPGHNSFLLKRLFGLLSNLPNDCHRYILSWLSIAPRAIFRELVEVGGTFTTYRIQQTMSKKRYRGKFPYSDDWQLKATARVMTLLEKANNDVLGKRSPFSSYDDPASKESPRTIHLVPVNLFYNMRLDYLDIIADFEAWERKESKFCFCQYPFYLSMGAKASIIDHDSKRQMETKARSAFISNISTRTAFSAYMNLKVRRECIVEDSLKGIGESVGTLEEHKKGLKVQFVGEDGIDAGGLRKEWFLLLAREVFDPRYGMVANCDISLVANGYRIVRLRGGFELLLFQPIFS